MNIKEFMSKLDLYAPLYLSKACMDRGDHDNSGVIIHTHDDINKVLFALDLSPKAIELAVSENVDTIVTHHPAIYYPVSVLDVEKPTASVVKAIQNGLNVISMHLNLDIAKNGIDYYFAKALGGKELKVIDCIYEDLGYGREFTVNTSFGEFVKNAKQNLKAVNVMLYGEDKSPVKKVASFCGGGSSSSLKYDGDADLIVTTDMPHHIIKEHTERGRKILLITHYASEIYGFKKFFEYVKEFMPSVFFDDKNYL